MRISKTRLALALTTMSGFYCLGWALSGRPGFWLDYLMMGLAAGCALGWAWVYIRPWFLNFYSILLDELMRRLGK